MSFSTEKVVEALSKAKRESKTRHFTQSVELLVQLKGIDLKKPENRVNVNVLLPHPLKDKPPRIGVIASGELALKAKDAGVEEVFSREDIEKLGVNKKMAKDTAKRFDFFIAQSDMMPHVGRILGRYLGPAGKMPIPVAPNADIQPLIERLKRSVRIRVHSNPHIMCLVGSENQPEEELAENIKAVLSTTLTRFRPDNLDKIYVKLTMGHAVKLVNK